jgi:hypothetical protein
VADVDQDKLPPGPLFYSSQDVGPDDAAELRGIAITASPAMTGLPSLRLLPIGMADLDEAACLRLRKAEPFLSAVLERARLAMRSRRFGDRTVAVHRPPAKLERLVGGGYRQTASWSPPSRAARGRRWSGMTRAGCWARWRTGRPPASSA